MKAFKRGFTLVELLVAMTITSIIILVLVGMSAMGVNAWTKSRAELRASRQGKALVDSLAKDLESKFMRTGNSLQWLYLERQASDLVGPNESTKTSNAARFAFFTGATDRYNGKIGVKDKDNGGDISLVRYQIQYVDPINIAKSKFQTYAVYRSLVNPDVTFKDILWTKQTDLGQFFPGQNGVKEEDFLCENVYQMTFTFTVQYTSSGGVNGNQLRTAQVSIGLDQASGKQMFHIFGNKLEISQGAVSAGGASAADLASGVVTRVEVMATVISDAGLAELRRGDAVSEVRLAEIVKKNSYQYVKSVEVPLP